MPLQHAQLNRWCRNWVWWTRTSSRWQVSLHQWAPKAFRWRCSRWRSSRKTVSRNRCSTSQLKLSLPQWEFCARPLADGCAFSNMPVRDHLLVLSKFWDCQCSFVFQCFRADQIRHVCFISLVFVYFRIIVVTRREIVAQPAHPHILLLPFTVLSWSVTWSTCSPLRQCSLSLRSAYRFRSLRRMSLSRTSHVYLFVWSGSRLISCGGDCRITALMCTYMTICFTARFLDICIVIYVALW